LEARIARFAGAGLMRRPAVFLGDLLRGLERLRVRDPAVAGAVMKMLSLDHLEAAAEALRQSAAVSPRAPRAPEAEPPLPVPPSAPSPVTAAAPPPARTAWQVTLRQTAIGSSTPVPPAWLAATAALPRPGGVTPPSRLFTPLFPRAQARALLGAALATLDADGPLDIERAVEQLAQLRPLRELPRECLPTLRRGAQLLVDGGLGMAPFAHDLAALREQLDRLLPRALAPTLHFMGTPLRGCSPDGGGELRRWQAPPPGTPVFVVTDLGLGGPPGNDERAGLAEWMDFLDAARAAGAPVTALVPYGPRRWPRALAGAVRLVHWDRRTTASVIRRTLERRAGAAG
jgi:hypothetical protein